METSDWNSYSKLILRKLDEHDRNDELLSDKIDKVKDSMNEGFMKVSLDINTLKTRSQTWGAVAGGLISLLTSVLVLTIKYFLFGG